MKKILIVKKDMSDLLALKFQLNQQGYEHIYIANSYESAVKKMHSVDIDIAVIDVLLSGRFDGIHMSELLHRKKIPFVFLISDCNLEIIDYVKTVTTKNVLLHPIKMDKLVNMLGDADNNEEQAIVDMDIISKITQQIKLTKKELQCLLILHLKNSYMSHEQLEKEIWPNKNVGEGTLRSLIRRVRHKLGENVIQSVHGYGYKLDLKDFSEKEL